MHGHWTVKSQNRQQTVTSGINKVLTRLGCDRKESWHSASRANLGKSFSANCPSRHPDFQEKPITLISKSNHGWCIGAEFCRILTSWAGADKHPGEGWVELNCVSGFFLLSPVLWDFKLADDVAFVWSTVLGCHLCSSINPYIILILMIFFSKMTVITNSGMIWDAALST